MKTLLGGRGELVGQSPMVYFRDMQRKEGEKKELDTYPWSFRQLTQINQLMPGVLDELVGLPHKVAISRKILWVVPKEAYMNMHTNNKIGNRLAA